MFTKLSKSTRKLLLLAAVLTGSVLFTGMAPAQCPVEPDRNLLLDVIQSGRPTAVIYVAKGQDPCRYIENWFLFEDYVYPSVQNGASFTVQPTGESELSREEFLREMSSAHPRGTHIDVFSAERRAGCQ